MDASTSVKKLFVKNCKYRYEMTRITVTYIEGMSLFKNSRHTQKALLTTTIVKSVFVLHITVTNMAQNDNLCRARNTGQT